MRATHESLLDFAQCLFNFFFLRTAEMYSLETNKTNDAVHTVTVQSDSSLMQIFLRQASQIKSIRDTFDVYIFIYKTGIAH